MKRTTNTLTLILLSISPIFAQNFAGKRIYSGNLGLNFNSSSFDNPMNSAVFGSATVSNTFLNSTFLTGKIRANNTYTAYGFNLGIINSQNGNSTQTISKNNILTIGPAIQFGKFVKVFDSFYYAPAFNGSVMGSFGSSKTNYSGGSPSTTTESAISGFGVSANVSPIRFVYQVKESILLSMGLGYIDLSYSYLHSEIKNSSITTDNHNLLLYGNVSNFTGIGAFYLF